MPISFNEVPSNIRRPWAYIEFDSSRAIVGPQNQPYKTLIIGQLLSGGSKSAEELVRVTRKDQGKEYFGAGSMLQHMVEFALENDEVTETWVLPLADDGAAVKATGKFAFTGTATASGTIYLYIGGKRVSIAVATDDTAEAVATALAAAITADTDLPVTATATTGDVDVEAKNGGEEGNYIDLRYSYYDGEAIPAGLSCTVTDMASGSGNPDIDDAFDAIGAEQYNVISHPYTDQSNLTKVDTELADRWGPLKQNEGHAFSFSNKSYADLATLGGANNSKHVTIIGCTKCPTLPWEMAAGAAAKVAYHGAIDPARPFQTLEIEGALPPKEGERLTSSERNLLLYDGIATIMIGAGGKVLIERMITTYQKNPLGADDTSFLDVNSLLTLSYLRYDFRNYVLRKYPRHKVADDGTRFGTGQAIVTPKLMKAECIAKFREWEDIGLVEGFSQFKNDLIVERNVSDPNRLDILMPPDLVNQLRIFGCQIAFLL